jgi:hypothetical protein
VKFSPALKWSLVLLLPLTLCWKLAVALRSDDSAHKTDPVVEFLTQHQFSVIVGDEILYGSPVITASSGECRLLVAKISPLGDSIDQVQSLATKTDRTFIVFRGMIYSTQPLLLTFVDYVWFRSLRRLGLVSHIPTVLAVVSSCDAEQLPWSALRFI